MNSTQRMIKYCAMAFAIILAIGIISGMASIVFTIINSVSGNSEQFDFKINKRNHAYTNYDREFEEVKSIKVDNRIGSLHILIGDGFRVEAQNVSKEFEAKVNGDGRLTIHDVGGNFKFLWFNIGGVPSTKSDITIYVPSDFVAKEVLIDTGAGSTSLEGIQTDYLYIEAGAGNINASGVVAKKVKWDGGVGSATFREVRFEESSFDCGVGNLEVNGKLLGVTDVDCGVGEVRLDINGSAQDYGYNVDTGIGRITWNSEKISGKSNGDADNIIKVDGGVGSVEIEFTNNR